MVRCKNGEKMVEVVFDKKEFIPTCKFPFAKFNYQFFNPVQSSVFNLYDKDENCLIASGTGSGKTTCAEMFISHELNVNKRKVVYLSPLKSLSNQKYETWTSVNHPFSANKISICTGDYTMSEERTKEINESDIIILTSEMLNSKCRNDNNKYHFFKDVGVVVGDEFHGISDPNRGHHLESGIINFTRINKNFRFVLLSGSLPNAIDLAGWISELTAKKTNLVVSDYRPCPLFMHFPTYEGNSNFLINTAINIFNIHPQDKFIFFVHSRELGKRLTANFHANKISAMFHHGHLAKKARQEIEQRFLNDPEALVLVATSTLAEGLDMPARRVVVLGISEEVPFSKIKQMVGRAGRARFDTRGDAYVICHTDTVDYVKRNLDKEEDAESSMNYNLCFHVTNEIYNGRISTIADLNEWHSKTLAHYQRNFLEMENIDYIIKTLVKNEIVAMKGDVFEIKNRGKVSSIFYYDPLDIADLDNNFRGLSDEESSEDVIIAFAFSAMRSVRNEQYYMSHEESEDLAKFCARLGHYGLKANDALKVRAACYYYLLKGEGRQCISSKMSAISLDIDRLTQALGMLRRMSGKNDGYFDLLNLRIKYGVPHYYAEICKLPGIGRIKAKKLAMHGFTSLHSIAEAGSDKIVASLSSSKETAEALIANAKRIVYDKKI